MSLLKRTSQFDIMEPLVLFLSQQFPISGTMGTKLRIDAMQLSVACVDNQAYDDLVLSTTSHIPSGVVSMIESGSHNGSERATTLNSANGDRGLAAACSDCRVFGFSELFGKVKSRYSIMMQS